MESHYYRIRLGKQSFTFTSCTIYPIIYIFRDNPSQKVRFMPAPRSRSDLEHTCGLQSQPQRWSFNESSPNQWDQFVVEYLGEPGEHI